VYWVLEDADTLELEPPVSGGSWLVGWPVLPLNPPGRGPGRVVTWSLYAYLAFSLASSSARDAPAVLAGLTLYRERLVRGLSRLYPERGHRLWAPLARCPDGGLAPVIRSPRLRLPGGRVYGVTVDYARDGEPLVSLSPGEAGEATVEGGKVRCPGGSLAPLDPSILEGRMLVALTGPGGPARPGESELRALREAAAAYRRGAPTLEALGLLPGEPRGGLSWLARRGVQRLHSVYPERAALAAAYALRVAGGPGEALAALAYAVAAGPWARHDGEGFTLTLQRVRPDADLHWEVDPLSWEGALGAVETAALLAAAWSVADSAPEPVYAAPWEPEAAATGGALVALPAPAGLERVLLAEEIALHWAPPRLHPPPPGPNPLEAALAWRPAKAVAGGPPGSEGAAASIATLLKAGYRVEGVEALTAYGPPASWVSASNAGQGPGVLDAGLALRARAAARRAALDEARRGGAPGRALDRGASEALRILTERWPLRRPDGSPVAVRSLLAVAASGALEGVAEAYTGTVPDGPTMFYLALRLLGPLPRSDAELLAEAAGERLSRLEGLVAAERSGIVRAKPLGEVELGGTLIGELAVAARRGAAPAGAACRLAEALAHAADRDYRLLAGVLARCRGAVMERWLAGGRAAP